uniref:Nuclear receptor domain-containing protein n=1 Tax=Syphacia muris TaxID=451379 RepID=A0A0N5ADY5_9BILA
MRHGYHFGVIACRACAAFFRRTVALNLKYRCRFDEQCPINKSVRCMCRKCRLAKCLKMGMNPQSIVCLFVGSNMLLFKHFWPRFLRLERAFATYIKLGSDITDQRTLLYNGSVAHRNFLFRTQETSWTPLKLLKPTEYEFIAMCGYLLWTIPARDQIFTALHQYYTEVLSLPAYAPRLAECMSLLSAVEVKDFRFYYFLLL